MWEANPFTVSIEMLSERPAQFPHYQRVAVARILDGFGQTFARVDDTAGDIAKDFLADLARWFDFLSAVLKTQVFETGRSRRFITENV